MTDEELVSKITKGETELFGEIIGRYEDKLKRYVTRLINQDEAETEDVVEEVFIRAYHNLNGYKKEWKFNSWIYRIGHNVAIDWLKKRRVKIEKMEIEEEKWDTGEEGMEEKMIREEGEGKVARMMNKLKKEDRELLWLCYFEDKSYEELADIFQVTTNSVAVRLNRAKKKLKFIWEKEHEEPKK